MFWSYDLMIDVGNFLMKKIDPTIIIVIDD
jgi:hypothetical protein